MSPSKPRLKFDPVSSWDFFLFLSLWTGTGISAEGDDPVITLNGMNKLIKSRTKVGRTSQFDIARELDPLVMWIKKNIDNMDPFSLVNELSRAEEKGAFTARCDGP